MRIVLHAGMCKTGTTSIQHTIINEENFLLLEEFGYISIPNDYRKMITLGRILSNSKFWMDYSISSFEKRDNIEEERGALLSQLKDAGLKGRDVIISSESLYLLTEEELFNFKSFLCRLPFPIEFSVIFCVREKVAQTVSSIQQIIRADFVEKDYLEEYTSYSLSLKKLTKVFGGQNVSVYSFEDSVKSGLVETFFRKIGLTEEQIEKIKIFRANESSSQLSAELMDFVKSKVPKIINGKLNEKRLYYNDSIFQEVSGENFTVDLKTAKEIYNSNIDDILWLKNNFGIDYSDPELSKYPEEVCIELTRKQISEIAGIYTLSNCFERETILEFLKQKALSSNGNTFSLLADTLKNRVDVDPFEVQAITGKSFVLWGAGNNVNYALGICNGKGIEPQFLVDSDAKKIGTEVRGIKVISPQDFFTNHGNEYIVFVTVKDINVYCEIEKQLLDNGVQEVYRLTPSLGFF